jgi:outer membrane lipoprotein
MIRTNKTIFFVGLCLLIWAGLSACAPVISEQVRREAVPGVTFYDVFGDPDAFKGKTVIFTGKILETEVAQKVTTLTVLEVEADVTGRPKHTDVSAGRFLARYNGYLDPAIFSEGRGVTVAGRVQGVEKRKLSQTMYPYPVLEVQELYLWQEPETYPRARWGWGFYYGPGYPFYWDDPWWW